MKKMEHTFILLEIALSDFLQSIQDPLNRWADPVGKVRGLKNSLVCRWWICAPLSAIDKYILLSFSLSDIFPLWR